MKYLLGGLALALILGGTIYWHQTTATKPLDDAAQHHESALVSDAAGDTYKTQAEAYLKDLAAAKAKIAAQDAVIAKLKALKPDILQPPATGADPCPELRNLAQKQEVQIGTQSQALDLCEKRGDALQIQAEAKGRAADQYKQEAQSLRVVIANRPVYVWAVGVSYGTDRQMGAWVEWDIRRLRTGAEVVRHPLNGGGSTLEAVGRVGWRF